MTSDPAARAGAILEVDLAGIAANWRLVERQAALARCAAVVKANAYGLGAALGNAHSAQTVDGRVFRSNQQGRQDPGRWQAAGGIGRRLAKRQKLFARTPFPGSVEHNGTPARWRLPLIR